MAGNLQKIEVRDFYGNIVSTFHIDKGVVRLLDVLEQFMTVDIDENHNITLPKDE